MSREALGNRLSFETFVRALAIAFALAHLYFSTIGIIGSVYFRIFHFTGAAVLIYLLVIKESQGSMIRALAALLAAVSLAVGLYVGLQHDSMMWRVSYATEADMVFSTLAFLVVLDITRRTIGWALPVIAVLMFLYAIFGNYIPGYFGHGGYSLMRVLVSNYVSTGGMFGTPIAIMARMIFVFILFGVTLEVSGAGSFFLNLAKGIAGRLAGGPAKIAVLASGMFGSMSGSAVANTVATGSLTIPMMKRTGYKPHVAAAIEAAASTGGQMVPPIMGAAAFLIGEFTGTPYVDVVKASILPALVYYASVYTFVHLEAVKQDISGLPEEEIPPLSETLKKGYYYFIPIIVVIAMFIMRFSVPLAAGAGTVLLFAIMLVEHRKPRMILDALEQGTISAIKVSSAAACAGVVVGIVGVTGVGLKFSGLMMGLAGQNLFLAIVLVGLASFILGMGLPVVASYIILVVVAGPGLEALGIPILAAHLAVFWFSQLSNITPPVALAAYAGAGIADADPMKTGFYAMKVAKGLPVIPLLFAFRPVLLGVSGEAFTTVLLTNLSILLGLVALTTSFQGYLLQRCTRLERVIQSLAGAGLLLPAGWMNLSGVLLLVLLLLKQRGERVPNNIRGNHASL